MRLRKRLRWWKSEDREVWIAGRWVECPEDGDHSPAWELLGVFTSAARAQKRCTSAHDFIAGPVEINRELGEEREVFPVIRYPWLETDREAAERVSTFSAPWLGAGADR